MSGKHEVRPAMWRVGPVGVPVFSEMITEVSIVDEAGGEFVEVRQSHLNESGTVQIDHAEWPALRAAINRAMRMCRDRQKDGE